MLIYIKPLSLGIVSMTCNTKTHDFEVTAKKQGPYQDIIVPKTWISTYTLKSSYAPLLLILSLLVHCDKAPEPSKLFSLA